LAFSFLLLVSLVTGLLWLVVSEVSVQVTWLCHLWTCGKAKHQGGNM
jgi:hypothetical protein